MNPLIPAIVSSIVSAAMPSGEPAPAQPEFTSLRPIPAQAAKARMQPPQQGYVDLSGRLLRLAPGAQIRDTQNRIVMSGSLQHSVPVRYEVDTNGDVSRVWILTPQEAARPDAR